MVSIVGAAGAMYAFVRSWGGRAAGMVAALVYTYAPYHLLNLYVRANLAESMAFSGCRWCCGRRARASCARACAG